jgi:calcineurin-like phosphoesterase family protein
METTYLIEIRLARTKWRIKKTIFSIAHRYSLESHMEKHPHVTVFGPLVLNEGVFEDQLLTTLGDIAKQFDPIPFTLEGWEKRAGIHGSVIAFPVHPSEPLVSLTGLVALALLPLSESQNHWDSLPDKKWFHVTLANRMEESLATGVFSALTRPGQKPFTQPHSRRGLPAWIMHKLSSWFLPCAGRTAPFLIDEDGLRLTVMKGEDILAEFDFLQKCWITTGLDHKSPGWQETLRAFRHYAGFERISSQEPEPDDIFVISDLHLGHANIIRYCSRPFLYSDVDEMNSVLIRNWNSVISPETRVYHLGDLRYGKESLPIPHYRDQLTGTITFIEGNHDDHELDTERSVVLEYDGLRFLLLHDPADAPPAFDGWVIHGHYHNNDLRNFPFLNMKERRINVSAEVIGYVPLGLREICSLIRKHQEPGQQDRVLLRYPYIS